MQTRVIFRFNRQSGEVERFSVEANSGLASAAHNREHEQRAADIGRILDPDPAIHEELANLPSSVPRPRLEEEPEGQAQRQDEKQRQAGSP